MRERGGRRHRVPATAWRALGPVLVLSAVLLTACDEERRSLACGEPPRGETVQLVYRVDATAPARRSTAVAASRVCTRLRRLVADPFQVRAMGAERIRIVARDSEASRAAIAAATRDTSLRFFDWEPNVLGPRGPATPFAGGAALFEAVRVASSARSRAERSDVRRGERRAHLYLFGPDRRPLGPPADSCEELLAGYRRAGGSARYPRDSACREQLETLGAGGPPAGSRALRVPAGIAVLEDQRSPGQPSQIQRYFVVEDDAELSRADIENPRTGSDEVTGEPVVLFDFTPAGRRAFKRLTARVAARAAQTASTIGASEAAFQHVAIAVDDRIVSLAGMDAAAAPHGIDAPGAQINGLGSAGAARRLARQLAAAPLEADLELVSVRER